MAESMRGLHRTHRCTEVSKENIGETVTVMGWTQRRRNLGSLIFIDLRDRSGLLQLVFDEKDCGSENFAKAGTVRSEFVLAAVGEVTARSGAVNPNLVTGDIEVRVRQLRILSRSETPPFPIEDGIRTKEELRLRYRYLDLRRPELQRNLMLRSRIVSLTRTFLEKEDFIEIETPMLGRSTPEGARDYLVPSRIYPGSFYALPQSPQLFKQLLMVSGYDRYFQIARCFRDEDLRADRQPDFTQIDMELSFVDEEDIMDLNERLLASLFREILGVTIELPLPRLPWREAMERFGTDKPDVRFGMELVDVSDLVRDCGFGVFTRALADGGSVRGINVPGQGGLSRRKLDALTETARGMGAKGLAWLGVGVGPGGAHKSSFAKFLRPEETEALVKAMDARPGDLLLFAADRDSIVFNVLGSLRVEMAKSLGLLKKDDYRLLWVTEFPQFEYSEEEGRYVAMHHPFTMPMEEDIEKLTTDPGSVRSRAYDIILNGSEIGGGSIRIHQDDVQEKMFEALGFTQEEAHEKFGFLLEAFQYGVPPHGGLAYGLDRLAMLMAGAESIRDVIAFPKAKDASCLMTQAPGTVEKEQLEELHIQTVQDET